MELWLAGLLFIACLSGAVFFLIKHRKNKKKRYIVLTALMALLGLLLLIYAGLTFILLDGIQ